jgi:hypothetical protein
MLVRDWRLCETDQIWALDKSKAEWGLPLEFLQDIIILVSRLRVRQALGPDSFRGMCSVDEDRYYLKVEEEQ